VRRKPISKKLRFEIFKRDSFTCQYCGQSAPDVILHVDHISPVSGGGDNDIMNLITSCQECNCGKGAKRLDHKSVLAKQKAQLDELNQRREQLDLMVKWRNGLMNVEDLAVDSIVQVLNERMGDRSVSEYGQKIVRKWLKKYTLPEILEAVDLAVTQYYVDDSESAAKVFDYIPRIAFRKKIDKDNPELGKLYYIRGIARNRIDYFDDVRGMKLLKEAFEAGVSIEELKDATLHAWSWSGWQCTLYDLMGDCK
jgi:hypothetical protein